MVCPFRDQNYSASFYIRLLFKTLLWPVKPDHTLSDVLSNQFLHLFPLESSCWPLSILHFSRTNKPLYLLVSLQGIFFLQVYVRLVPLIFYLLFTFSSYYLLSVYSMIPPVGCRVNDESTLSVSSMSCYLLNALTSYMAVDMLLNMHSLSNITSEI